MKTNGGAYNKSIHFVLRHKKSGKISSNKNQGEIAIKLEAMRLTNKGLGGGIISALMPKSLEELTSLKKTASIYKVEEVTPRKSNTDRKALIEAIASDELIAKLSVLFGQAKGDRPSAHSTSVQAFVYWLRDQIKDNTSRSYKIIKQMAPIFLNAKFGDRWFIDAIGNRKKRRVNGI